MDKDLQLVIKGFFGTLFLIAVAPVVIQAVARAVPRALAGPVSAMPAEGVFGQEWIDPYTGTTYIYAPVVDTATFDTWVEEHK